MADDDERPSRPELPSSHDVDAQMRTGDRGPVTAFVWTQVVQGVLLIAMLIAVVYLLNSSAQVSHNNQVTVQQYIQANNQRWCATMDLLTATPVTKPANPAANPSRVAAYQLYVDFEALRRQFGCG